MSEEPAEAVEEMLDVVPASDLELLRSELQKKERDVGALAGPGEISSSAETVTVIRGTLWVGSKIESKRWSRSRSGSASSTPA